MNWAAVLVMLVVVPALVAALKLASRWAGNRGWVFNKHNPRPKGSGIPGLFDQIYQPGIEHVIDEQSTERTRADQAESGDKPDSGFSASDA